MESTSKESSSLSNKNVDYLCIIPFDLGDIDPNVALTFMNDDVRSDLNNAFEACMIKVEIAIFKLFGIVINNEGEVKRTKNKDRDQLALELEVDSVTSIFVLKKEENKEENKQTKIVTKASRKYTRKVIEITEAKYMLLQIKAKCWSGNSYPCLELELDPVNAYLRAFRGKNGTRYIFKDSETHYAAHEATSLKFTDSYLSMLSADGVGSLEGHWDGRCLMSAISHLYNLNSVDNIRKRLVGQFVVNLIEPMRFRYLRTKLVKPLILYDHHLLDTEGVNSLHEIVRDWDTYAELLSKKIWDGRATYNVEGNMVGDTTGNPFFGKPVLESLKIADRMSMHKLLAIVKYNNVSSLWEE